MDQLIIEQTETKLYIYSAIRRTPIDLPEMIAKATKTSIDFGNEMFSHDGGYRIANATPDELPFVKKIIRDFLGEFLNV